MRFAIEQRLTASPEEVARAFADADLYASFGDLPKLSRPELVDRVEEADLVRLQLRYRFVGDISPAARAILDPAHLTWVEHSDHDLAALTTSFVLRPDHYAGRFTCSGAVRFEAAGDGTVRRGQGDLRVRAPLVGGAVERALVSGLQEHLTDEVPVVEAFLRSRSAG
ncbi:MAG: DUF2505 family protein [Acidimicrobiales bacterium]|nr:DUF2505 family protein [Acidimicrobiales bacterium]